MNRLELVDRIAARARSHFTKSDIDRILLASLEEIVACVREGHSVTLIGFGTFRAAETPAHLGRNPSTGEQITIPAQRKPKFIAGTAFRETLNPKG